MLTRVSARIDQIHIILPGASPVTLRKKKVSAHDELLGSFTPSKRRQDDDENDENERPSKGVQ